MNRYNLIWQGLLLCSATSMLAQNPIITTKFTADPAPYVHGDTLYLYTSHDADDSEGFKMYDWLLYTTTDMANWTDHGAVASLDDFKWYGGKNGAWAPQVIERNGKWYMYCPIHVHGISVLVADTPYGPFRDLVGEPIIWQREHWYDIDPTVWIDDDGQAYLYWGNPHLYMAKLNEDMISIDKSFGKEGIYQHEEVPEDYQEGPWFYKRGKFYYLAYASTCCPEGIGYSISRSPFGPWKKAGTLFDHNPKSNGNHPGIVEFKGHNYIFGFDYSLHQTMSDLHAERRSVCVAEFQYEKDGTIREMAFWDEQQVTPLSTLNPYRRTEAETMASSDGVHTARADSIGIYVTDIHDGDYIKVRNVDFGSEGARRFKARVASMYRSGNIELRIDAPNGKVIGQCQVDCTGGSKKWVTRECPVTRSAGIHDLYFIFHSNGRYPMMDFDYWEFE